MADTCPGETRITLAEADLVGSAALVAVTLTTCLAGGTPGTVTSGVCGAGAVNRPVVPMVPTDELPPAVPFTDQVTLALLVPLTVAVNCAVWP